jgi:hypothetical protein
MCFLPNRRASIDQAPGPIAARLNPNVANMIEMRGLPPLEKAIQTSNTATRLPAIGVHKPTRSSIPAAAPIMGAAISAGSDVLSKLATAP